MLKYIKQILENRRIRREGGQKTSIFLREKTLENNSVDIGLYSYGSCFNAEFNTGGFVKIGRYCSFGPNVRYFGGNHPMCNASMSPYFYQNAWAKPISDVVVTDIERSALEIGNDCWIGYGVTILPNCRFIGNGAVVGAGSVVTKDVPPYSVVVGNPAKIVKYRFDFETINIIEDSKWYELPPEKLLDYYEYINNPKEFAFRCKKALSRS